MSGRRVSLVQGASRGIGRALVDELRSREPEGRVFATCREPGSATALAALADDDPAVTVLRLDVSDPDSIGQAAQAVESAVGQVDRLINVAGILHEPGGLKPEKKLADLDGASLGQAFTVNSIGPLIVARGFQRLLWAGDEPCFAALSARVGSIGDNRLGGWYAYRMSKAALNMGLRTLAVEWRRGSTPVTVVALHPGTVATDLSAPFLKSGGEARVFTPEQAAAQLLDVLDGLSADDSGGFFAWDGQRIPW